MKKPLNRLVYYSQNRIAGGASSIGAEVQTILAVSQRNNSRDGITGALMFNQGCFAQVLEGVPSAVEAAFERIQRDARHSDVSLLSFEPVAERAFGQWSMGFVGAAVEDAARFGHIGSASGFDISRMSGDGLFELLHRLALEEETAAA